MTVAIKILDLFRVPAFLVALFACSSVLATDFGLVGKIYPISETNFLDYVQKHIEEEEAKGRVDELNEQLETNGRKYIDAPPGIVLPRTEKYSVRDYDPTFVIKGDIADHEGMILYRAGQRVNPLDHKDWTTSFCFIDGNDEDQVKWLLEYCSDPLKAKMILVNGPVHKLMKEHVGKRFYFDQKQKLVFRFGIQAVPAIVRQSGRMLVVEEFPID